MVAKSGNFWDIVELEKKFETCLEKWKFFHKICYKSYVTVEKVKIPKKTK